MVIPASESPRRLAYQPRFPMDSSGSTQAVIHLRWAPDASLEVLDNGDLLIHVQEAK